MLVFLFPAAFPDGPAHRDAAGHGGDISSCTWEPPVLHQALVSLERAELQVWNIITNTSQFLDYCQEDSFHCASESCALSFKEKSLITGGIVNWLWQIIT